MESDSFLNDEIAEDIPTANIASVSAEDEIEMDIVVTIDATDSTADIAETNDQLISDFENAGFDADEESTFKTFSY